MRTFKTEGIVIKRRNNGEADKFLTIFTKDFGKMQLKATGVRRIASKRSPHVELLNLVEISFYKGKGMPVLVEAQSKKTFDYLKSDLMTIGLAYHLCELIDGLCPEDELHRDIFFLFEKTLSELTSENSLEVIHGFEVELLTILGYWNSHDAFFERKDMDTQSYIETLLERRLKSRRIFSKLS
jgi:DNA repair protein RecO (recombination protein O)